MDNVKLKIRGNIKVTSNRNVVIYNKHNQIEPGALGILINCLYQDDYTKQIDTIEVSGTDIGTVSRAIISSHYDPIEESITFKTVFYEFDFDGTIEELKLVSNSYGIRTFATKTGVALYKDNSSRIQIEWKIKISV